MSLFQRAFLFTLRKKGKSLIIFLILLIVSTFALTGLSINMAAGNAALSLRHSLGGSFLVQRSNAASNYQQAQGAPGSQTYINNAPYINDDMVKKVTGISGIDHYNLESDSYAEYRNANSQNLKLAKTTTLFDNNAEIEYTGTVIGTLNSQYLDNFQNRTFTLVDGNPITADNKNSALISSELAKLNDLKVGDTIELSLNDMIAQSDPSHANDKVNLKIVGIFNVAQPKAPQDLTPPTDLLQNDIVFDIGSYMKLYSWNGEPGYQFLECFVHDPAQIDNIISKEKDIDGINWQNFQIGKNDTAYQSAAGSLESLMKVVTTLIVIIILVCIAVLTLILTMWIKNRVHETGILLSIGISKVKIVCQYIVEILIVAIVAFALSYFLSMGVAYGISDTITKYAKMSLNVSVLPSGLLWVYGIGAIIIVVSVLISSLSILRLNPKEILTKMS